MTKKMMTKKAIALLTAAVALLSSVACQSNTKDNDSIGNSSSAVIEEIIPTKLKNLMTENERSRVKVGELTLLDMDDTDIQPEGTGKVQIYIGTAEDWRELVESLKDCYESPEEYEEQLKLADTIGGNYIETALVDGRVVSGNIPALDYDGGEFSIAWAQTSGDETGKHTKEWTEEYKNFDEYKSRLEKIFPRIMQMK